MIDLRNIETFFWVATLGGFRAAAEKLNATQPAISQRIASLEADLKVRLFERDTRGIRLTAKGQELLSHAERMLQLRHDMQAAAVAKNVMSGTLRLGVSETLVHTWLPRFMERLHDAYPALMVEIQVDTTTALEAQLASHQIDLAFLLGPLRDERAENLFLCDYPLSWLASPKLKVGRQPVALKHLAQWPIITYSATTEPHRAVRHALQEAGVKAPRMYGSSALSVIVRMAMDGIGTAVIAPIFLREELNQGELRILQVKAPDLPPLHYTASWMRGPDSHVPEVVARMAQEIAHADSQRRASAAPH
ncbi:LysR family transcriptional regulator [Bordetella hinzii]|uniref:LysR family transcriptional regulator n=1 Tax=Bordetella hinzii TaxID=103855 RepID=UPI00040AE1CB|nr:LysR family transcriptional regulator [Bordetella hinzii]AKQ53791.1 HTH-type transcriptional regulator YofA [Bordetella hinzii]KCB29740.1 LysR substrate-binding domain protein [Bordetella hinzii L60]KCB34103.1 LysR substrate-binding domain protein [Bordetella hinzii CA90 BAL1384]KCB46867.1 LysR substrate-binding domain protein [Bordetella hinzii 1277]WPL83237.1 LysR family transcriptional regulator [Bordetella hinzii]